MRAWLRAARDAQISGELELVYAHVAREIARRGPTCWASGRCCNFEKTGHRLYVTGLEAAHTVVNLGAVGGSHPSPGPPKAYHPLPQRERGNQRAEGALGAPTIEQPSLPSLALRAQRGDGLTIEAIDAARARGGCPFQVDNLCGVHAIRPLGCRVYFCDRTAQAWQGALSESALADIRAIHDAHVIPYRYGEWREMLVLFVTP